MPDDSTRRFLSLPPGLSEEEQRRSAAEKRLEELLHGSSLRDVEARGRTVMNLGSKNLW